MVDPHADLVAGLLEHVPAELAPRVRLIDLADRSASVGINLLDTRVFADRDRTADSVVRVARGLWDQWGPRMQSILEHTVKSLHEANLSRAVDEQYTILDGLRTGLQRELSERGPRRCCRPLHPFVVGERVRGLDKAVRCGVPGPGADAPFVLRVLKDRARHPGAVRVPPSTCAGRSWTAECSWSRPPRARLEGTLPHWWAHPFSISWTL